MFCEKHLSRKCRGAFGIWKTYARTMISKRPSKLSLFQFLLPYNPLKKKKKKKKKRKCYLENCTTWKDLAWLLPLINFKHNLTYSTDSQYATFFQCVPFIVSLMSWVIFMSSTDQKNVYWSGLLAKFKEVAKYLLFNVQPTFRNSLFP